MGNTTTSRAAEVTAQSRSSRPATSGNKNVRATRVPKPDGNATLGATQALVNANIKGPFLSTTKPTG